MLTHLKKYQVATGLFILVLIAALYASNWLAASPQAVAVIEQAGYLGVMVLGIIGGFNALIPIPPATFSSLYNAAGLSTVGIVLALALGTSIADLVSFWFGSQFRSSLQSKYEFVQRISAKIASSHHIYIWLFVLCYASFVPFPNEAILIPLAISGVRLVHILVPLLLGGILHQYILVVGLQGLASILG